MMSQSLNGLRLPIDDMGLPAIKQFAANQLQDAQRVYEMLMSEGYRDSLLSAGVGVLLPRHVQLSIQLYTKLLERVQALAVLAGGTGSLTQTSEPTSDDAMSEVNAMSTSNSTALVPFQASLSSATSTSSVTVATLQLRGFPSTGSLHQTMYPSQFAVPPSSVPTKTISITHLIQVNGKAMKRVRASNSCVVSVLGFCIFLCQSISSPKLLISIEHARYQF